MNTGISLFNSVNSAVCRPLLDWQLLTPETTFGLLVDKMGGMTFWKQISQAFLTLSLSLFSTIRFFLALFLRATLHYPNAWNRLCFRVGRRTITFPSHFCHHIWCVLICGCSLYDIQDKKEWVLVRREVLVSGLFFRSRSLELYLASILKIIATCDQAIFFFLF